MRELAHFQQAFSRALLDPAAATTWEPALTVHRNTLFKGLVDALEANYPTVARLVGPEWFRACAIEFARQHPARSAALVRYGEGFPAFLSSFGPASELPYLAEVARIDRLWVEAHTAADAKVLEAASFAGADPTALFNARLRLHPATRFGLFRHSAATIWMHHRTDDVGDRELEVNGAIERLLLTRPSGAVHHMTLEPAAFVLLEHLAAGASLGEALCASLDTEPRFDAQARLSELMTHGAFADASAIDR